MTSSTSDRPRSKPTLAEGIYALAVTLWVGGLLAIGYLAVPVLFAKIPDRMQAGEIAGVMFAIGGWLGCVCAVALLLILWRWHGHRAHMNRVFQLVGLMLLLGLIGQFVVQPQIAAIKASVYPLPVAESARHAEFARWHGASSILYLLEALLGVALVVKQKAGYPDRNDQ